MSALVSVVIPHYGDPAPTLALLDQLARQQGDHVGEIIVVDDASPEPFAEPNPSSGVRVVRRATNGGFGSTVNVGVAHARHDLLLILNSDLTLADDTVTALVAAAAPFQPAVVGPRIVDAAGAPDSVARFFPTVGQQVVEWLVPLAAWRHTRALHRAVGHDPRAFTATAPLAVDWLVGACLLLPTRTFRSVGGFDERFHMNAEEVDLQLRLARRGVPRLHVPSVTVVHEGGGSSDPERRRGWLVASRLAYADKWGGAGRLRLGLSAATAVNLAWNTARRVAGRPLDPLAQAQHEWDLIWGPRA